MTPRTTDPLLLPDHARGPQPPDRLFYATGVLLDAEDFQAEQLYHRGRLARALAYLHGDGTVAGLAVDYERSAPNGDGVAAERVRVRPGIAVDRIGRIIEVPRDVCLRLDRWYAGVGAAELDRAVHPALGGVVVDVFIRFAACPRGKTPAFADGPFDATDAVQPSRLRDGYEVKLFPRAEDPPPLPDSGWESVTAGDAASLRQAVLGRWQLDAGEREWDGTLRPRREHLPNQDATSVFLARITIPATRAAGGGRPARPAAGDPGAAATVDNAGRRLVYPVAALARFMGL